MSHDKNDDIHTFLCDGAKCNEFYEGFTGEGFKESLDAAKDEGWVARKKNNEWEHYCPACQEDRK